MYESSLREYQAITNDIKISVVPCFVEEKSEPSNGIYVFAYHVTLENLSSEPVQLINRHWKIFSGGRPFADVKGEGVIGERPVLNPGVPFEYSSWTVISEQHGSMQGCYTCRNSEGDFFDAEIPEFELLYINPDTLH